MKKTAKKGAYVFVLMPFHEPFDQYYKAIIKPAIKDSGSNPVRADEIAGPRPFIDDIFESIQKANVVIADITGRNPNVIYEIGFAHALRKPIIMVTQSVDEAPFDLRHQRMIVYNTTRPAWSTKLRDDIHAAITDVLQESPEQTKRKPSE